MIKRGDRVKIVSDRPELARAPSVHGLQYAHHGASGVYLAPGVVRIDGMGPHQYEIFPSSWIVLSQQ